jgi:hypothetical protein
MSKNKEARRALQRIYNNLARAANAAADLQEVFYCQNDKRVSKAAKAVYLIMEVQGFLNPMAEDEDIQIV